MVVWLAIHAIAIASCTSIYYLLLANKRQNFYALKPNTWGSYTYTASFLTSFILVSTVHCRVMLHL